jgi:hypothetical protein
MINNVLSICWVFFISFSSCIKEKNVQINKSHAFIMKIYKENNKNYIDADYVQYFIGDKAIDMAKKNGDADSHIVNGIKVYSIPGDFYIVNQNNKIRKLEVSDNVKIDLTSSDDSKSENDLNNLKNNFKDKLFVLSINNDKVIEIQEIFTP